MGTTESWYSIAGLDFGGGDFGRWDDPAEAILRLQELQAGGEHKDATVVRVTRRDAERRGEFGAFGFGFVSERVYP